MADEKNKQVKVFSADWCGFCKMTKAYLESKGVEYVEVNIEQEPDAAAWLQQQTGRTGIPVTLFGGKDFVIGFDREQIDGYLRQYKLI